jgi:DNA-binding transcriptional ArsR family regulator
MVNAPVRRPEGSTRRGVPPDAERPGEQGVIVMDKMALAKFEARARIVKAMAHPSRLFIVEELSRGERCVCELRDKIGSDMSTVSKHLSILKGAGIIQDEKRGSQVYYKLGCPCVLSFFECVEKVIERNARAQLELVK